MEKHKEALCDQDDGEDDLSQRDVEMEIDAADQQVRRSRRSRRFSSGTHMETVVDNQNDYPGLWERNISTLSFVKKNDDEE